MFWPDIIELKHFYSSPLGKVARRRIRARITAAWPEVYKEHIVGLGFATPFLRDFLKDENRVTAIMPAAQGVMHWPPEQRNVVTLADEAALPLPDSCVERVILIHALEHTDQVHAMMQEAWRILAPNGKLLAIVPNRRGLWSRIECTPFAYGHPFSINQMLRLLRSSMFVPLRSETALFMPPSTSRLVMRLERALENIGSRFLSPFGGVLIIEAEKQIYAVNTEFSLKKKRVYIPSARKVAPTR